MENQRNKEIIVGVVSILALALLFLGISLGKGFKVASDDKLLKIRFPNSGGLQVTEPVVVNGVKRGTVINVKNDKSSVLVTVLLDDYNDIKSDATAKITLLEITGGKKIEITPGAAPERFSLKQVMKGETPPDLGGLVALLGDVSGDLVSMVRKIDTIAGAATNLLADGKVVNDIRATTENIASLSADLNQFVNANYAELEKTVNNLSSLTTKLNVAIDKHEPSVGKILSDIDLTLKDAKTLLNNIDGAVKNADNLVSNVNKITEDIKNGQGFVGKILYDKEINSKLDSTFTNLSELMSLIKNHGVNVNVRLGTRP